MSLEAYFDESGTNPGDEVFVIGGFMATPEKWQTFSDAWRQRMREWELPYFHMTDFENRKGLYESWSNEVRHARLNTLLDLIVETAIASFLVALSEANFREVYGDSARAEMKFLVAGRRLFWDVSGVNRQAEQLVVYNAQEERISLLFESGARGAGSLERLHRAYYRKPLPRMLFRLSSFSLGRKDEFPLLQAADILAYEGYKHWSRQYGVETRPSRYPSDRLANIPHIYSNLTVETLHAGRDSVLKEVEAFRL